MREQSENRPGHGPAAAVLRPDGRGSPVGPPGGDHAVRPAGRAPGPAGGGRAVRLGGGAAGAADSEPLCRGQRGPAIVLCVGGGHPAGGGTPVSLDVPSPQAQAPAQGGVGKAFAVEGGADGAHQRVHRPGGDAVHRPPHRPVLRADPDFVAPVLRAGAVGAVSADGVRPGAGDAGGVPPRSGRCLGGCRRTAGPVRPVGGPAAGEVPLRLAGGGQPVLHDLAGGGVSGPSGGGCGKAAAKAAPGSGAGAGPCAVRRHRVGTAGGGARRSDNHRPGRGPGLVHRAAVGGEGGAGGLRRKRLPQRRGHGGGLFCRHGPHPAGRAGTHPPGHGPHQRGGAALLPHEGGAGGNSRGGGGSGRAGPPAGAGPGGGRRGGAGGRHADPSPGGGGADPVPAPGRGALQRVGAVCPLQLQGLRRAHHRGRRRLCGENAGEIPAHPGRGGAAGGPPRL